MKRFWSKVDKSGECWLWLAAKNRKGYGIFWHHKACRLAHNISYEMARGPIPEGSELDHTCWGRACVRPSHMRLVAHGHNTQNRSGAARTSQSGMRGVYLHSSGRWQAQAGSNGRNHYLGLYSSADDANEAVIAWRRENMPYSLMDQKKD